MIKKAHRVFQVFQNHYSSSCSNMEEGLYMEEGLCSNSKSNPNSCNCRHRNTDRSTCNSNRNIVQTSRPRYSCSVPVQGGWSS